MLIAGDIGGTKTDLAIFSSEAGPHSPLEQSKMHSADYPSLQAMVKELVGCGRLPENGYIRAKVAQEKLKKRQ